MKRTLVIACLLAMASATLPTSTEAGLFSGNFRCRMERMRGNWRGFMGRMRNDDCCCDYGYGDETIEGEPTPADGMAPAPAPDEAAPAPAPEDTPAAPEPADASA